MADTRYVDPAAVTAFWQARGGVPDQWAAAEGATQDAATQVGSEWLDRNYRERWKGARASSLQIRDWPRVGVVDAQGNPVDPTTAPIGVKSATCIAATLHVQGQLEASRSTPEIEALLYDYVTPSTIPESTSPREMLGLVEKAIVRMLAAGGVQQMAYQGQTFTFTNLNDLERFRTLLQREVAQTERQPSRSFYRRGAW